ncbi:hypothetical protein [Nocardia sp. CA-119907]|uniref:hypothetical protein n=1 Tax=Nocardia sp. CA-119907 TaxID=3239973 RepID=UPI003D951B4A
MPRIRLPTELAEEFAQKRGLVIGGQIRVGVAVSVFTDRNADHVEPIGGGVRL